GEAEPAAAARGDEEDEPEDQEEEQEVARGQEDPGQLRDDEIHDPAPSASPGSIHASRVPTVGLGEATRVPSPLAGEGQGEGTGARRRAISTRGQRPLTHSSLRDAFRWVNGSRETPAFRNGASGFPSIR